MSKAIPKIHTEDENLNRIQDLILGALNPLLRDLAALAALVRSGRGSPEGVVHAPAGTLYLRTDGAGATLYVKESGNGPTGWAAK